MMELFCENNEGVKADHYFRKKAPSYMFDRALNTPLYLVLYEQLILCKFLEVKGIFQFTLIIYSLDRLANLLDL